MAATPDTAPEQAVKDGSDASTYNEILRQHDALGAASVSGVLKEQRQFPEGGIDLNWKPATALGAARKDQPVTEKLQASVCASPGASPTVFGVIDVQPAFREMKLEADVYMNGRLVAEIIVPEEQLWSTPQGAHRQRRFEFEAPFPEALDTVTVEVGVRTRTI